MNHFFELIQIAIGTRQTFDVAPSDDEWRYLFQVAEEQALVGVLLEAIEKLPQEQMPPRDIRRQWLGRQSMIISQNRVLDERAAELTTILAEAGFDSCVLKGQGTALYYPHPEQRMSGDIDIWVEGRRKELLLFLREKYKLGRVQNWHHTPVSIFDDVEVELHHHPSWLYNPMANNRLQNYYAEQWPIQHQHASGKGFSNPTVDFAYVYCILHIYRHLLDEGVGLRQVLDLYYIVLALPDNARSKVQFCINRFGLGKIASGLMYVLQVVFAMPESFFICPVDERYGRFILDEILEAGNFGQFDERNVAIRSNNRAVRALRKFFVRQFRFVRYFPSEVLWIVPWRIWQTCIWRSTHTVKNVCNSF